MTFCTLLTMDMYLFVVTLLGLSATFDTIDHTILLQRLERFWQTQCCSTLVFFLPLKHNSNCYNQQLSIFYGVPQGSVLGPVFLSSTLHPSLMLSAATLSFTILLLTTLGCRNLPRHNSLMNSLIQSMQECIHVVKSWVTHSKLKLNDDKREH